MSDIGGAALNGLIWRKIMEHLDKHGKRLTREEALEELLYEVSNKMGISAACFKEPISALDLLHQPDSLHETRQEPHKLPEE